MKPILILPPNMMSPEDLQRLRDNDICVVEATEPGQVRFLDPLPAQSSRTEMEQAAIALSRRLLKGNYTWSTGDILKVYVDLLVAGTSLDIQGTKEDQERQIIDNARLNELQRIAREEARAERAAKKAKHSEKKQQA